MNKRFSNYGSGEDVFTCRGHGNDDTMPEGFGLRVLSLRFPCQDDLVEQMEKLSS